MIFQGTLLKYLRCKNIVFRLCSTKKRHTKTADNAEGTLVDARDPHCNPYLEEPTDETIETYKDSKKYKSKILKKVLVEKELDANARSTLTKECKYFVESASKHLKASAGCSVAYNQAGWQTYDFDQFQIRASKTELTIKECPGKPEQSKMTSTGHAITVQDKDITKGAGDGSSSPLSTNRLIRQEPGKVIATFIPVEFWQFFFPKTGVSGFYTFLITFATYLVSKEIYVLDHSYYHGLGTLFMWIGYIKYIGPPLARYLDREIDNYEDEWKKLKATSQKALEEEVVQELFSQFQADGQLMLIDAKRENVALQLEEEYRFRQMQAYDEVKRILDYHVECEKVRVRFHQRNLVEYVTDAVQKSITPDLQNKLIYYSIDSILKEFEKHEKGKK